MSCTTDTCRDKTLARLPAIVKVNRKRTNEAAEVALALATANARNFVAKYCARIAVVQRFTSRTPIFPFRWKNFVFPFFYFLSWILLSLLLNRTLSFLSFFFFLFSFLPFPSNTRVLLRSRERSLTRAFYVRRARFSAVIDTTSVESTQTDRINSVGRFQFNAKRGPRAIS